MLTISLRKLARRQRIRRVVKNLLITTCRSPAPACFLGSTRWELLKYSAWDSAVHLPLRTSSSSPPTHKLAKLSPLCSQRMFISCSPMHANPRPRRSEGT